MFHYVRFTLSQKCECLSLFLTAGAKHIKQVQDRNASIKLTIILTLNYGSPQIALLLFDF